VNFESHSLLTITEQLRGMKMAAGRWHLAGKRMTDEAMRIIHTPKRGSAALLLLLRILKAAVDTFLLLTSKSTLDRRRSSLRHRYTGTGAKAIGRWRCASQPADLCWPNGCLQAIGG
jgi:hypothetical protein